MQHPVTPLWPKPIKNRFGDLFQTIFFVFFALFGLASCRSLPSLQPFASQTSDVTASIRQSVTATQGFVSGIDTLDVMGSKELKKALSQTDSTLYALNSYAVSLANLADAGKKGNEYIDPLAKSLAGLGMAAGLGPAPASAAILLKYINQKRTEQIAIQDLRQIISLANPVLESITALLSQNLENLNFANKAAGTILLAHHKKQNETFSKYYEVNKALTQKMLDELVAIGQYDLVSRDRKLLKEQQEESKKELLVMIITSQADGTDPDKKVEQRRKQLLDLLALYRQEMKEYQAEADQYQARLLKINSLKIQNQKILDKTNLALHEWNKAHIQLGIDLGRKKSYHFRELASIGKELVGLAQTLNATKP